jgi:RHS repeat-associated protein
VEIHISETLQGAGGVGGLVMSEDLPPAPAAPVPYFPTYDGNGNITAWVDSNGHEVARQRYDAFGNLIARTGAAPSSYGFSTKPIDQVTGLLYYGYRYYDPVTGRWPSRDPIGEAGGINLYGFVRNKGVSRIDILGLLRFSNDDPHMVPGQDPLSVDEVPKIKECEIWIYVSHLSDVAGGVLTGKIFGDLKNDQTIKSLDLRSKNPCARVGFLPCLPQTGRRHAINYIKRNEQSYLDAMILTLPVKDVMVENHEGADKEGKNAKQMITAARDEAKKIAKDQLCTCSCKCKSIKIHVQLFGASHLPEGPDNTFISNFVIGRSWKPLFTDIIVPCERENNYKQ